MARRKRRKSPAGPPATQQQFPQHQVTISGSFSGPLPPPNILEKYNMVIPGSAERILMMAENQSASRQVLERIVVTSNARRETLGQICGLIVALAAITGGVVLALNDKSVAGLTAILTPLAGLVIAFIYGKRSQKAEVEQKRFFRP